VGRHRTPEHHGWDTAECIEIHQYSAAEARWRPPDGGGGGGEDYTHRDFAIYTTNRYVYRPVSPVEWFSIGVHEKSKKIHRYTSTLHQYDIMVEKWNNEGGGEKFVPTGGGGGSGSGDPPVLTHRKIIRNIIIALEGKYGTVSFPGFDPEMVSSRKRLRQILRLYSVDGDGVFSDGFNMSSKVVYDTMKLLDRAHVEGTFEALMAAQNG
jgi:hypothetical protein